MSFILDVDFGVIGILERATIAFRHRVGIVFDVVLHVDLDVVYDVRKPSIFDCFFDTQNH